MSKVNASIVYLLGSFIFLLSVIIPQFANAQEDIPKINDNQKEALELFSSSQSQHQQTSAVDIQQNNLDSDKNVLKKIIQQELQEKLNEQEKPEQTNRDNQQQINTIKAIENSKSLKEQGQEQQQQQQQQAKQGLQQQQTVSDNNQMETFPEVIIFEHANFEGDQQRVKESVPNVHSWNDKISSVIVKSGTWQFFEHENYGSPSSKIVGPGFYEYVETPEFNIRNDNITAIKALSASPQGDHLNSKSLKEQGQKQVTNNDKEIKALELFFNTGSQQQELQQHSNEGKQQQGVKTNTATAENSKPVKEQGQEPQQQQVKQGTKQKADSSQKQTEPFMLFFNAQVKEQQQQYLKQQQLEEEKQKLQEILNEQEKQQQQHQQPIQQQQKINQQQIEQEVQQKLEQEKQKLQEKLNEQKK